MNIRVDLNTNIADGSEVVFRSPADCSQVTGLVIYHNGGKTEFAFADAHGNNVGDIDHLFAENAVVKVILDVTAGMAFVQNADTNAYIERTFVKTVNGRSPDEKGNVEITIPEGTNCNCLPEINVTNDATEAMPEDCTMQIVLGDEPPEGEVGNSGGGQLTEAQMQEIAQRAAKLVDVPSDDEIREIAKENAISVSGAKVGQVLEVAAVDEQGVPTAWAAVDPVTQYPIVEMSNDVAEIRPNVFYRWGEVASLNITFADALVGVVSEYLFEFRSGETAAELTLPDSVRWVTEPTIDAGKKYQVSVLDGLAVMIGA